MGTNHKDPCPPDRKWLKSVKGKIYCPKCNKILVNKDIGSFDTILGFNPPPGHRIQGGLSWVGICIYHIDFILQIQKYINEYGYVLGKCFDPAGNLVPEYVTCYTSRYVIQRGNKDTKYKRCEECSAIEQLDWWHGRQYLTKKSLHDRKIVQNIDGDLYLSEDLYRTLDFSPWPDAAFDKIAIFDKPVDGQNFPE